MKYHALLPFVVTAVLTLSCNKPETSAQQLEKVQAEAKRAVQDLKGYTFTQKAEFTASMKNQLAEINQELDRIAARIEASNAAAKAEAKPKLQALREKADELGKQLEKAKDATEPAWESVKAGSAKAFGELKEGFTQARQWVSEKIAP